TAGYSRDRELSIVRGGNTTRGKGGIPYTIGDVWVVDRPRSCPVLTHARCPRMTHAEWPTTSHARPRTSRLATRAVAGPPPLCLGCPGAVAGAAREVRAALRRHAGPGPMLKACDQTRD